VVTVQPGAEPYFRDGQGNIGVLLCHGFTSTPAAMRPWAERLAAAGLGVSVPRLPGHGTDWRDANRSSWPQWLDALQAALAKLREKHDQVFVAGLSMGGTLALLLAARNPDDVRGLVLVNPSLRGDDRRLVFLPVLRHLVPSVAGIGSDIRKPGVVEQAYDRTPLHALHQLTRLWRVTRDELPGITQPMLVFRSDIDHVVSPRSVALLRERAGSRDITVVALHDSFHVATLDNDAQRIVDGSLAFVRRLATDAGPPAPPADAARTESVAPGTIGTDREGGADDRR
jgi:carboxylesterase